MYMFGTEVVLMVIMFIKFALSACNFNVISNETMVQAQPTFDSALEPMTIFQTKLSNVVIGTLHG